MKGISTKKLLVLLRTEVTGSHDRLSAGNAVNVDGMRIEG